MDDINVGKKVQEFRQLRGMTCKELAALSDITPSMLTQIERSQANPSINTVKAIARALEVPLYLFFLAGDHHTSPVVRKEERRIMGYQDQPDVRYELLMPDATGTIEFCKMTLFPQHTSADRMMAHSGEEMALVMSGTATVIMEGTRYVLHEGDSIRIPPATAHRWENSSAQETSVIFAISPPSF